MDGIYLFLLKSIVVSGVLCAWYALALRNKKLTSYNRFFLLFTLYASIQLPLLHFSFFTIEKANTITATPALYLLHVVNGSSAEISSLTLQPAVAVWDWSKVFEMGWAMVSGVLLVLLLVRIAWVMRLRTKYSTTREHGVVIVATDLPQAPFSFFNLLFWDRAIPMNSESGQLILRHEMTHIQQGHSWDKLISQLATIFFWFNPFYWFIQRELELQHEFIADSKAVKEHDTATFATLLLQTHNGGKYLAAGHSFFSSPIKRRLVMLQTPSNTKYATLRRLCVLPIIAGTALLFSFREVKAHKYAVTKADKKIVIVVDAAHGGKDAGCRHGSFTEKELSLKVANRIKELSPAYNIEAHLTRTGDDFIKVDERVAIADKIHPDDMISIHINDRKDDNPRKGDFDIFVMDNGYLQQSKQLGKSIFENISLVGGRQKQSLRQDLNLLILRNSKSPAVLLELGDIKDDAQMAQLSNDDKLDELCNAILKGVVDAHRG